MLTDLDRLSSEDSILKGDTETEKYASVCEAFIVIDGIATQVETAKDNRFRDLLLAARMTYARVLEEVGQGVYASALEHMSQDELLAEEILAGMDAGAATLVKASDPDIGTKLKTYRSYQQVICGAVRLGANLLDNVDGDYKFPSRGSLQKYAKRVREEAEKADADQRRAMIAAAREESGLDVVEGEADEAETSFAELPDGVREALGELVDNITLLCEAESHTFNGKSETGEEAALRVLTGARRSSTKMLQEITSAVSQLRKAAND